MDWTDQENEYLQSLAPKMTIREIAQEMGRSSKSVWHHMRRLGLLKERKKAAIVPVKGEFWTKEETEFAIAGYLNGMNLSEIASHVNRSEKAVKHRLQKVGLYQTSVSRRNWTAEEEDLLEQKYSSLGARKIAEKLNRTVISVKKKAAAMRLNAYDDGYLKVADICRVFNVDNCVVSLWIKKYGMPCHIVEHGNARSAISYNVTNEQFWKWAETHQNLINWKKYERGSLVPEPSWVLEAMLDDQHTQRGGTPMKASERKKIIREWENGMSTKEIAEEHGRTVHAVRHVLRQRTKIKMNGEEVLTLPIKKKWYDMILSGEKKEEYRDITPFYTVRLKNLCQGNITDNTVQRTICFRNGYSHDSPSFFAKVTIRIGQGNPEWGAEPGKDYYVMQICEICDPHGV